MACTRISTSQGQSRVKRSRPARSQATPPTAGTARTGPTRKMATAMVVAVEAEMVMAAAAAVTGVPRAPLVPKALHQECSGGHKGVRVQSLYTHRSSLHPWRFGPVS